MTKHIHGGDVYKYDHCLDFSANCNPLGTPQSVKQAIIDSVEDLSDYPRVGCGPLKEAIADYEHTKKEYLICGNGAADLIFSLSRALNPKKALLPAPTFAEYEQALVSVGCEISRYYLKEENDFCIQKDYPDVLKREKPDIIFLCNPNNPTGNLIPEDILVNILDICRDRNIVVVADECFLRFNPQYEIISCKRFLDDYDNLVIINAFTKFYAMAGIRLGYMMSANTGLINRVSLQLPEWNVSSVAQRAGIAAFADKDYEKYTHELIQRERQFLFNELSDMKCIVYPSQADYLTFRLPQSKAGCMIQEELLKHGILIRSCGSYHNMPADCYRIAVKQHADNEVLINNMRQILEV